MIYNFIEVVCMIGVYVFKEEVKKKGNVINCCGWWFKLWFYQYVEIVFKRGEFVEYIFIREYYYRYIRFLYWEGKFIFLFVDQFWFRFFFGWLMLFKVFFFKVIQGEVVRNYYYENYVIQDMFVFFYKVGDVLEWVYREMEVK